MKMVLDYNGSSESFKELDLLLSTTSALGEGFLEPIRSIVFSSYHVDQPGVEEKVRERMHQFYVTFTVNIRIFSESFISTIFALLDKGVREHCLIYPLKENK